MQISLFVSFFCRRKERERWRRDGNQIISMHFRIVFIQIRSKIEIERFNLEYAHSEKQNQQCFFRWNQHHNPNFMGWDQFSLNLFHSFWFCSQIIERFCHGIALLWNGFFFLSRSLQQQLIRSLFLPLIESFAPNQTPDYFFIRLSSTRTLLLNATNFNLCIINKSLIASEIRFCVRANKYAIQLFRIAINWSLSFHEIQNVGYSFELASFFPVVHSLCQ